MPHTNRAELNRLFANFCRFWTEGLHATVQMTTKGNCRVMAQFEFELKNRTTSSYLDLLASGEVNLKVNHSDTRDTSQALAMHPATLEQRETIAVAPVAERL